VAESAHLLVGTGFQHGQSLRVTITVARQQSKTVSELSFLTAVHTAKGIAKQEGVANRFRGLVRNTAARSSRHFLGTHGNHRCVTQRVEIRLSGAQRFLDRKVMQSEALLHCAQQRLIRLGNPIQTRSMSATRRPPW
jgi:hypothetical protein